MEGVAFGNLERFAPDADTPAAREASSQPTIPAPPPVPNGFAEEYPSGVWPVQHAAPAELAELKHLGRLSCKPQLAISPAVLRKMKLDAPTGFLLSLVDGRTDIEELLDVCAMPRLQALRLLGALRFLGIIDID